MSVFGSQSEDPLLQNDPLAPSPEDEEGESEPPEDRESSTTESTDKEAAAADPPHERGDSVFGQAATPRDRENDGAATEKEDAPRVIVRSFAEAARGGLAAVNEAIEDGWVLERVQVNDVSSAKSDAKVEAGPPSSLTLAFVLRRTTEGE